MGLSSFGNVSYLLCSESPLGEDKISKTSDSTPENKFFNIISDAI